MDNNIPKGDKNEKKPYHKHSHHRRKPNPRPAVEPGENSPNGQVIVRGGRYDLPPEQSERIEARPLEQSAQPERIDSERTDNSQKKKPEPRAQKQTNDDFAQGDNRHEQKRRPRGGRRRNKKPYDRQNQGDELTLTANADPSAPTESEIIEEMNSADSPEEAPGIEVDAYESEPEEVSTPTPEPEPAPDDYVEPIFTEADFAEPEPPLATYEIVGVKFKATGKIYYFDPGVLRFKRTDAVVVDTARGLEYGIVELGNRTVTEREVVLPLRQVVRRASQDDIARAEANAARAAEAFSICADKILEHKLAMKLVDVEYTFDNSKLLFYFTADGRVDFRELVKDLASVFRTRIELRQIGIRDETKLLGGIGICGRPFCCKTFLSDFVQVSIKMAKEQSLSLNSAKISGACGRLMCCLRYEYDTYSEEIKKTPRVDQIVSTPDGDGLVIESQPLAGTVRVRFTDKPDTPPKVFHRDEVTVIGGKGVKK